MNIFVKGATALGLAITAMGAAAVPAQAQYYGGYYGYGDRGWRNDRDWDRRWDNRRWDDRRWRGDDRRYWRGRDHYRYRQRCWTEWRYDYYRDRDVRVRICR